MKQLLIVNSATPNLKTGVADDLTVLEAGELGLFMLKPNAAGHTVFSSSPDKNFGIALGRGDNKLPFVIPEVDIDTLDVVVTNYEAGNKFEASFTFPTPSKFEEYTVMLVKKGTVPHERNTFTVTIVALSTDAATEAARLVEALNNKSNEMFNLEAEADGASITISALDDTDWNIVFADNLYDTEAETTPYKKTIGDKAYIEDLAQRCAADKGFNYLDQESLDIYPGYPENVEDKEYTIVNLHFATGRKAGKQVDERVWQYVHIAVPSSSSNIAGAFDEYKA